MDINLSAGRRVADTIAMLVVAAVSLLILVYIAFGEARRNYERFQIEKLVSQGQVAQSVMENFVRPGLPMNQFVGFSSLVDPMVEADPLIDNIGAFDTSGQRVFSASRGNPIVILPPDSGRKTDDGLAEVRTNGKELQVILPLKNRFETAGTIVLTSPREAISKKVEDAFRPLFGIAALASLFFAMFVVMFAQNAAPERRARMVAIAFALKFTVMSAFVVHTLFSVYTQGAQSRAKAIADSLAQRLDDVVSYGLSFDDITGVIALVDEYKRLNPEIRAAALVINDRIRAHSAPVPKDGRFESSFNDYEYRVPLSKAETAQSIQVVIAMPKAIVYNQVLRSGKNFVALFVACAFIAALFMGVARSLQYVSTVAAGPVPVDVDEKEKATLNLVKPVFFLAVFVEHLNYAFLPQMMQGLAHASQLSTGYASLPFLAYYACFAISLVPAGRLDNRVGSRVLMLVGLILAGAGIFLLANVNGLESAILARALAGIGQGTLFIGVQSYVLANSSSHRKTQAGSAIVFGFQAGMIAGMAIGSLLVSYIGRTGVFELGTMIAIVTTLYAAAVLPRTPASAIVVSRPTTALADVKAMLTNAPFVRSMLLIGVPAKAVLTGVVLFAMPILLTKQGFAQEDIGQFTMAYAGAVILASTVIAKYTDQSGETERVLFYGGLLTAIGLGLIALVGLDGISGKDIHPAVAASVIGLGVMVIGVAHGFINAPVVTHVAESKIAQRLGVSNVASTYRLVERAGHMIGPVLMGQIFVLFGPSWSTIGWIAGAVLLLTILFPHEEEPVDHSNQRPVEA
ncbi:MFS_MdtG_SLC18_like domain containing protein [Rhabdaerophilaceae bacterium]